MGCMMAIMLHAGVSASPPDSPALSKEAVFGRHLGAADEQQPIIEFSFAPGRILHRYTDGRLVAEIELPANWRWSRSGREGQPREASAPMLALEILVLDGELYLGDERLTRYDYLQWPAGFRADTLHTEKPAKLLVFFDPPRSGDPAEPRIVRTTATDWGGSSVSQRDTGVALKLEIRSLFKDDVTGRWTWLLRAGPDLVLPWEVHRTVEEVYLVEGDYRLYECLPDGKTRFDYRPGGYFHRPAGIVHGGPDSGSPGDILMLLRTPTELTVEFKDGCSAR
ncbi:MAG: hypothetical protein EBR00_04530 [Gammaproteobacteria bacterium]|nr:hypothetical protein [Gammaproteobacteria bacterium]